MISVVIPVYNEERTIPELHRRLTQAAAGWSDEYEVIVVDDGSQDRSWELLRELHGRDPRWKVLALSRNFGHQAAISAGLCHARGDAVAILDGDLQDPPEEIARFLEKWRDGFQVVYAVRTKRKEGTLKRFCYGAFYRILRRIASTDIPLDAGDFCVMDRAVVDVLKAMPERTRFVRGLRSWAGFRQIGIPYERQARHAGDAKYSLAKLIRLAEDGLLSFSHAPLRLASWLGVLLCGLAFLLVLFVVTWWATDVPIYGMRPGDSVGWTSLVSLILLLAGMQMLMIGVVGEYLARVFEEVKMRPPWVVARSLGLEGVDRQHEADWNNTIPTTSPDRPAPLMEGSPGRR